MEHDKVGVWIIGVKGSIATTMILGVLAMRRGIQSSGGGMLTATELFSGLPLPEISGMVFGGCDIRSHSLADSVAEFRREFNFLDQEIDRDIDADLAVIEANISLGTAINCGASIEQLGTGLDREQNIPSEIDAIRDNLRRFRTQNGLAEVVVINLASTEPPLELGACHHDIEALRERFAEGDAAAVRASTLYAYAAIMEGCPYVNFTPSNAALPPALVSLAETCGVPVMGNDGKTGETLVKSTLAPMFTSRNLEVLSWEGFNLLGNLDGKVLDDPENCASKLKTKDEVLQKILGYAPHSSVHINYVPSLGDQKTAWDFIHFKGFLDAKMTLQFTWQGYDSLLAAPLALDLVRLAVMAKQRQESGLMRHLASFFKAPIGVSEYRHAAQFEMLTRYIKAALDASSSSTPEGTATVAKIEN